MLDLKFSGMVFELAAAALELLYKICCGSGGVASSYVVKVCKANGGQHGAVADGSSKRARLTDAFTKLLMPGTNVREISACVISKNRLL